MLPTKGYFQDIECPYFENSCGRPYCHFRHRKKQLDLVDESSNEETPGEVPTYKPTPKSELAVSRSHIPISYVPDIIYRAEKPIRNSTVPKTTFLAKPTYKPTPISLLTSAVKNDEESDSINELKQSMADRKYSPKAENVPLFEYKPTALEDKIIDENLKKHEYKPTGENSNNIEYNPTALEDISEHNSSDVVYKPTSNNIPSIDYKPSAYLLDNSNINFENLDTEFDMIDEIINMSDKTKQLDKEVGENLIESVENNDIKIQRDKDSKSSSKKNDKIPKKISETKADDRHHKDNKKYDSKHKTYSSKSSKPEEKSSRSSDSKSSSKEKDKKKDKISKEKEDSKRKEKEKNKDKERHKDSKSKEKERSSKSRENEDGKKIKDKEKNEKVKVSKHDKEKVNKHDKKDDSKERNKHKHKHEDKNHHKSSDKSKKSNAAKETRVKESKDKSKYTLDSFDSGDNLSPIEDIDIDLDDDETMRECYRIFNEYKPDEESISQPVESEKLTELKDDTLEELFSAKKRIAHSNAPSTSAKFQLPQPKSIPTPGQMMANRFKVMRTMQASNEEKLITNEVNRVTKRSAPTPSLLEAAKKHKIQKVISSKPVTSLVDDIISGNKSKPTLKKIAPVSNVMNIQRAKAQLEELNKKRAAEQMSKTVAQTNKVGKRQAHIPEYSLNDIPDVLDVDKSKLPVNVRTRYLTMLADECCKLYLCQNDAYKRALDEEYSCYQKCKVLLTYRNSAMLAVNRIRKEVLERDQNNLGLLGSGESSVGSKENTEKSLIYKQIKKYILSDDELDIHGYPKESAIPGRAIIKNRKSLPSVPLPKNQRKCSRCSKIYLVDDDGKVIYEEECLYHSLKKRTIKGEQIYLCCKSTDDTGCAMSHTHVSEMSQDAELDGFQTTMPPESENDPRSIAVYALDCEMCYTTKGLELTRVTIVDTNCKTVYESLVKPLNKIIDYNTRFSGITKQQMDRINTGILQVQANILHLCNSRTILIGHSLESDMKALKIVHGTIVDTAVLFPHKMGLPHKRALRALASDYLKKIIQNDVSGHDSAEDAITCMELVKWKVKEDTKFKFSK